MNTPPKYCINLFNCFELLSEDPVIMEHSYEAFEEDSASIGTLDKETSAKSPQYKVSNSNRSKSQRAKRKREPPNRV